MRSSKEGLFFFERAVTLHRQGCEILSDPRTAPIGWGGQDETGTGAGALPDNIVAYRVGAGKAYEAFRGLIGQLAGLLILVQASGRREILDLPDLRIAEERWQAAGAALAGSRVPDALAAHKAKLDAACQHIGACLREFEHCGDIGGGAAALVRASDRIGAAYQMLKSASDADAGLSMVDFRQACCTCMPAQKPIQERRGNG